MNQDVKSKWLPLLVLIVITVGGLFVKPETLVFHNDLNKADMAWVITACCLVFLMTPGLSFFYGGMVDKKNVISTIFQSFIATGVISIVWVVVGFSIAFGDSIHGIIGNPFQFMFFRGVLEHAPWKLAPTIPLLLFALYQLKFAVIAPAIIVGAVAERVQFKAFLLFMVLFTVLIYAPIAHWTWSPDGFLFKYGVLDFAGGIVVHISSGCAALAGAIVLKQRKSVLEKKPVRPANIPFVLLGTSLLWFGWFGFNAGSAMGANNLAVLAFATTNTATAAAGLAWILYDNVCGRKPSAMGFCIGAVVGMVAITPGAGFVGIPQSLCIGFIAAIISNYMVHRKNKLFFDDTLDVFSCHGMGGLIGMLLTGVFTSVSLNDSGTNGLIYGNATIFVHQFFAMMLVLVYSFIAGWAIFKLVNYIYPLRVSPKEEEIGLDITQHDEVYI